MNRLQQDAADSLAAHEQRRWRERAKADYQRSQGAVLTGTWSAPELSQQERTEREQQIKAGEIPF